MIGAGLIMEGLGLLKDAVAGWWQGKQAAAKHQREIKAEQRKAEAQASAAEAEVEKQRARTATAVAKRTGKTIRVVSFVAWSGPLVHAYIDPAGARDAIAALDMLPEWWVTGYLSVTGAIWGIPAMRGAFRQ